MKNIKSLLIIIFIVVTLISCAKDDMDRLIPPVIVAGISKDGSVTLCNKYNEYIIFPKSYYFPGTIKDSYKVGDTLKYFNLKK